jgi:hypothetical protein
MPPLQKTYPRATLTRSGGEVLITIEPVGCTLTDHRWGFSIEAKTDKKGIMKATVKYGEDKDYPNRKEVRRPIEDFTADELGRLACQIVDKATGKAGSTVWRPPLFRSVTYAAMLPNGDAFSISVQARQMRLDLSEFAPEPCTAEVVPGRRKSDLAETTAMSLEIDDAYAAFVWALKQHFGRP